MLLWYRWNYVSFIPRMFPSSDLPSCNGNKIRVAGEIEFILMAGLSLTFVMFQKRRENILVAWLHLERG